MTEEPTLPTLARNVHVGPFAKNPTRKRVRDSSPQPSSDPPMFSSDDDPSVERYTQGRRKQQFRGPWYNQQLASDPVYQESSEPIKHKRPFERQYDSGVWMGSDFTDMDDSMIEELIGSKPPPASQQSYIPLSQRTEQLDLSAQEIIERCLELGKETIDLSGQHLEVLSNSTVRPLAAFTKSILFFPDSLVPNLRIILSSNYLKTIPRDLFNLEHLYFLSLRNNRLQELPPGIGKLNNLVDLSLSQNSLRYLPYEILSLFAENGGSLQELQLHPNPFYVPEQAEEETPEPALRIGLGSRKSPGSFRFQSHSNHAKDGFILSYKCKTETRFLNTRGRLIKGPELPSETADVSTKPYSLPVAAIDDVPVSPLEEGSFSSQAHSLYELALKACSREQPADLVTQNPDTIPEHVSELLLKAEEKNFCGPTQCTICNRTYIIPRTEWIEWWSIVKVDKKPVASAASPLRGLENERDKVEKLVPLMRRGCTWQCIPPKSNTEEEIELTTETATRAMPGITE